MTMKTAITLLVIFQLQSSDGLTQVPVSMNVTVDTVVEFHCGHPDARSLAWKVNGSNPDDGGFPDVNITSYEPRTTTHLCITAHSKYNSTNIECIIFLPNNNTLSPNKNAFTTSARLLIQGDLGPVSNLHRHNVTTISWIPPASLDLTDVDPDIVYCVEIYNITCGGRHRIVANCSVFETHFSWNISSHELYEYEVVPRSNVEGAGNGTSASLKDQLPMFLLTPTITTIIDSTGTAKLQTVLSASSNDTDQNQIIPPKFIVILISEDGLGDLNFTEFTEEGARGFNLTTAIPIRRRWKASIIPYGIQCTLPVVDDVEISSHDIQISTVVVTSQHAGEIEVTGQYLQRSTASGVLTITVSSKEIFYDLLPRQVPDLNFENIISGLPGGEHTISLFVVKEDGLPFERVATRPRSINVLNSTEDLQRNYTIESEIKQNGNDVCVKCTFLESSTTDCVAVVHQRISQLNSSGLMNIESSYKFTRSADTASGCIEGVNLEDYQVGVVGGRTNTGQSTSSSRENLIIILLTIAAVITMLALIMLLNVIVCVIICCRLRPSFKRKQKVDVAHVQTVAVVQTVAANEECEGTMSLSRSHAKKDSSRSEQGGHKNTMEAIKGAGVWDRGREGAGKDNAISKEVPQSSNMQIFYVRSDTPALKKNAAVDGLQQRKVSQTLTLSDLDLEETNEVTEV